MSLRVGEISEYYRGGSKYYPITQTPGILEHIRSHMIITSGLIQCSPSRLTMQMSVSPVHPSRLSRIVKTPEINSTHRDLILIQILVSNSKKYSRTSILNFRTNIGFTPSSRVYIIGTSKVMRWSAPNLRCCDYLFSELICF